MVCDVVPDCVALAASVCMFLPVSVMYVSACFCLQFDASFDEMPPLPPRIWGPGVQLPLTVRSGEPLTVRVHVEGECDTGPATTQGQFLKRLANGFYQCSQKLTCEGSASAFAVS